MKIKLIALALLVAVIVSACISYPEILNKSFPSGEKYDILGSVTVTGTTIYILGLPFGGATYADLLSAANEKFKSVDDVVSVSVDKEVRTLLGIITWVDTILRGIAIRYVKTTTANNSKSE